MNQVRGIRGATTAEQNEQTAIEQATAELLQKIMEENQLNSQDVVSCFITMTPDLNAAFPARAIREMTGGWDLVPLLGAQEVDVPGAVPRCIRLLLHVNTTKQQAEIQHVYLRDAVRLRPDLMQK